jgi:hypothetical protein
MCPEVSSGQVKRLMRTFGVLEANAWAFCCSAPLHLSHELLPWVWGTFLAILRLCSNAPNQPKLKLLGFQANGDESLLFGACAVHVRIVLPAVWYGCDLLHSLLRDLYGYWSQVINFMIVDILEFASSKGGTTSITESQHFCFFKYIFLRSCFVTVKELMSRFDRYMPFQIM